ncbi:radical SAM family heme chaperone HemW [Cellulosilyticum sp. I15G10I2]|uniref:radical SAM family heme chaperone HemW n=1 Tax=Cellulosilyticum sp. I15G10I2 TaxID=1892843 RepID=UPI00085C34F6|nr:radical SAM family heme chaperone HemW [Cellulosilyticum sp. I15G10I2]
MKIGIYIHIPFCISKCYYCDFLSFPKPEIQSDYCRVLIEEIKNQAKLIYKKHTIKTIFIGGGTPMMLPPLLLDEICLTITEHFILETDVEWTIEANPGTITADCMHIINAYPINRISLGLQSTHNRLLKLIGRRHTFEEWAKSISLLKENTTCSLNSDIMFALPTQTLAEFQETLEVVASYDLDHISLYALIIEEGTRFWEMYQQGEFELIDEETDRKMYHYAKAYLKSLGYMQYEISNWSKPRKACKHNILYWKREPYIGIGLGAHSFFEGIRYHNETKMEKYLQSSGQIQYLKREQEVISQEVAMQEFMFLGLRMTEGISITDFNKTFKTDLFNVYKSQINKWIKLKILVKNKDNLFLSDYGMDICNEVFSSFL